MTPQPSELHEAAYHGNLKEVQALLRNGTDVNVHGGEFEYPLQAAARQGRKEIVEILLKAGADVNAHGGVCDSALNAAILAGNREIIKSILSAGADIRFSGEHFGTPLHLAAYRANKDVVELLLQAGADVNGQGGFYGNPLQAAASYEKEEIIEILLNKGANVNAQGGVLHNALQAAAEGAKTNIVRELLQAGAEVNARGGEMETALQAAAQGKNTENVRILLAAGAEVNTPGGKFGSALHAATRWDNVEAVQILLDAGAAVNAQDEKSGNPLQTAAEFGSENCLRVLLGAGADANAKGGIYGNPLQAAVHMDPLETLVYGRKKESIEILLAAGASPNAEGGLYGTALLAAAFHGQMDTVRILLDNGASASTGIRKSVTGASLLHAAVQSLNCEILRVLLNYGAENLLHARDTSGQTPFHLAVSLADLQMLEVLKPFLQVSLSIVNTKDIDGRTPLHLAVATEDMRVVQWVLDAGAQINDADLGDITPYQQASQLRKTGNFKILQLLYSKLSSDPNPIPASQWRNMQPESSESVIVITKGTLNTIKFTSMEKFNEYITERSYSPSRKRTPLLERENSIALDTSERRTFILADDSVLGGPPSSGSIQPPVLEHFWWRRTVERNIDKKVWKYQPTIPSAVAINRAVSGECYLECRLSLPVFTSQLDSIPTLLAPSIQRLKAGHDIIWILIKPSSPGSENKTRPLLECQTFFSTLEHATVPNSPAEFYNPLVEQLQEEWYNVYKAGESHLSERRAVVLRSNGRNPQVIKDLLQDALLCETLTKLVRQHISALETVKESYSDKKWSIVYQQGQDDSEIINRFGKQIENLQKRVLDDLALMTAISQELIQLEFNLTSIAEAQTSNIMNRSMKRLSWITFIFLPLTFVTGLFGMNVNLLANNPNWKWYILATAIVITVTVIVWITFKQNNNLEDQIESKFKWVSSKLNRLSSKLKWYILELKWLGLRMNRVQGQRPQDEEMAIQSSESTSMGKYKRS